MLLSVIVPCFNEEESIPLFYVEMKKNEKKFPLDFEYIFIDDGSTDRTLEILRKLNEEDPCVHYYSFSRNFGKEAALFAGLQAAKGDFITVMDVDLQDPPELLVEMYEILSTTKEVDCVGTRRTTRIGEPKIRSLFARLFYKIVNRIGQTEMVDGARDYRLMTRKMVDSILEVTEYNRFSKGIFTWVGYKTVYLEYENRERVAGETSWDFWKLFSYSIDGIINFSDVPLNLSIFVGVFSCVIASIGLLVIMIRTILFGDPTQGWSSLVSIVLFMGGLQLLSLGILGKYIGKIFLETKKRPIYILKEQG